MQAPRTMRLVTMHGRDQVTHSLNNWGFDGPTLDNVVAVHFTYGQPNIFFVTAADADAAHALTGWPYVDDNSLCMKFNGDLLQMREPDGQTRFYGDWELQTEEYGWELKSRTALPVG